MRLGIANEETWGFFNEIYADFQQHYDTHLFERRTFNLPVFQTRFNRMLYHRDLQQFMDANDVVFFEWASQLLVTATHLSKTCKIVTRLHRYELYKWVDHVNWSAVDKVILVSRAMERAFVDKVPEMRGKTAVTSPSTSLEKFTFTPKPFSGNIGILCHLTPRKRVYDLILDFYEVSKVRDDLTLHIGGGEHVAYGDYYQAMRNLVVDLDIEDKVIFDGHVTDTPAWYRKIDLFVSNSFSEGLQVSPMEAMATGCYCLSHKWRGAEELLPEKQLFFTSSELQQKILDYCEWSDADKQQEKVKMRALACERFDINKTIDDIHKVIRDVGAVASN
jgi:glycosyltransferase involved in cell wall biosynthesis